MIADKYREKTAGMSKGEWAFSRGEYGQHEIDVPERNHRVFWIRDVTDDDGRGICFQKNTRSEVADLIEAVEEIARKNCCGDPECTEENPLCDSCLAHKVLTALREKMEELE